MDYLLVVLGLALLVAGGEVLVRGALGLSVRFRMSPAVIGAVVMGFGTSTPELAASLSAALAGAPGLALGNVIGSNVANVALILAASAVIVPLVARIGWAEAIAVAAATLGMIAVIILGGIGPVLGAMFLGILAIFLWVSVRGGEVALSEQETEAAPGRLGQSLIFVTVGLVLLIGGAQALVSGTVDIAEAFGVPPSVIRLTVVAIGTSLPELAASLSAAVRGQGGLALGNIVGSNSFNVLGILGITALVHPIAVPPSLDMAEVWALAITGAALLVLGLWGRVPRAAGALGLAGYAGYMWLVIA
ncbi:sodium:calcium antiporter [Rhodobacteraceae bacterium N5(2021)]|uniref:Sodium:calcium antiporter n=1 Tax=Gymnodinialimonas phycosphaerae TaxID=2841589 RepID=A0A975TYR1_9RHOB|nr:sodium:calcium antiporter [Gymnodinialimonas phycosphaerae]MBY4893202.1 sodium:calcium antiporter [Gymnodinialimonas phycosphaerae]